jgi:hypothetical protein
VFRYPDTFEQLAFELSRINGAGVNSRLGWPNIEVCALRLVEPSGCVFKIAAHFHRNRRGLTAGRIVDSGDLARNSDLSGKEMQAQGAEHQELRDEKFPNAFTPPMGPTRLTHETSEPNGFDRISFCNANFGGEASAISTAPRFFNRFVPVLDLAVASAYVWQTCE